MTSLRALLASAGFHGQGLDTAVAVAMAESGGHPTSHNTNAGTGDNSYGLFQINMLGSLGPARMQQYHLSSYNDLFDPTVNARVAYQLSQGGTNWTPWTTYTRGTYKQYLGEDMQIGAGLPDPNSSADSTGDLAPTGPPHTDSFDISDGQSLAELQTHQAELRAEVNYAVGAGPLPSHAPHPVHPGDMSPAHPTDPSDLAASAMPSSVHPSDGLDGIGGDDLSGNDPLGSHSSGDGQSSALGHGLGTTADMQEGLDFDEHYLGWHDAHH